MDRARRKELVQKMKREAAKAICPRCASGSAHYGSHGGEIRHHNGPCLAWPVWVIDALAIVDADAEAWGDEQEREG